MIQWLLQQEIWKGLGSQQSHIVFTYSFACLLCESSCLKMSVKADDLMLLDYVSFSIKSDVAPAEAGHALQDTLPVLDLPHQAAPPACPPHVLFLRTPRATFGLIYKARDSYFETQLQHIHSLGSKLLPSQTAPIPIPFSIPACV